MGIKVKLKAPKNITIDFKPSSRQYELWKLLQPECHICGGEIKDVFLELDHKGNKRYRPVCQKCKNENIPRLVLGGGAAGGGKTWLGCMWILTGCLKWGNKFKGVLARKTLKVLKETTFATFLICLREAGLAEDENFSYNEPKGLLTFWNGAEVLLKELTVPASDTSLSFLGGLEATASFIDECDTVDEKVVDVLASRMRFNTPDTLQVGKVLLSCNPNLSWVRGRFVIDENGEEVVTKFGEFYVPFSLYDNPNDAFRNTYEALLQGLPEREKQRLLYGNWFFVQANDAACYKGFSSDKHLVHGLFEAKYDKEKPYILSFDFNVYPYLSTLGVQINYEDREVYFLEEFPGYAKDKRNNSEAQAQYLNRVIRGRGHEANVIITGDPSGLQRSTLVKESVSNYSIIKDNMRSLKTETKLLSKQPSQSTRLEWINSIFENNYDGWRILIDARCFKFVEDLVYQLRAPDGTKLKTKVLDSKSGIKYEKYGHMNDCMEMVLCYFLNKSYASYKTVNYHTPSPYTATITPVWNY